MTTMLFCGGKLLNKMCKCRV